MSEKISNSVVRPESELFLSFTSNPSLALDRTLFRTRSLPNELFSVRGKSASVFYGANTFQWYSGAHALSIFFLRAALQPLNTFPATQEGRKGSPLATLDLVMEKSQPWICEMFGSKADGTPLIREIIRRRNCDFQGRGFARRSGQAAFALNEHMLKPEHIHVTLDGYELISPEQIEHLVKRLDDLWRLRKTEASVAVPFSQRVALLPDNLTYRLTEIASE